MLQKFDQISGREALAGQHNFPNPLSRWSDRICDLTGKFPAIFGQDFGFAGGDDKDSVEGRPAMIEEVERQYRAGAVLLITGPFDADAHLHSTKRADAVGFGYSTEPLTIRHQQMQFPDGDLAVSFSGAKTTTLSRAVLPTGKDWAEAPLGKGRILFSALPLELNDNLQALGEVYRYALQTAGVSAPYKTTLSDPGILISPTQLPAATLYVITSESNQTQVNFTDARSGRPFNGKLDRGRAAILLVAAVANSSLHITGLQTRPACAAHRTAHPSFRAVSAVAACDQLNPPIPSLQPSRPSKDGGPGNGPLPPQKPPVFPHRFGIHSL